VTGTGDKLNDLLRAKNDKIMQEFAKIYDEDYSLKPLFANAAKANALGKEMVRYLQALKDTVSRRRGGDESALIEKYFLENIGGKGGKTRVQELKDMLAEYKSELTALLIPKKDGKPGSVTLPIDVSDGKYPWEESFLKRVTADLMIYNLTQLQGNVLMAEWEVINYLYPEVMQDERLDSYRVIIEPKSSTLMAGQPFKADIYIAAFSTSQKFNAVVNGQALKVENGVAKYETVSSTPGENKITLRVNYKTAKGEMQTQTLESSYYVYNGSAVISADQMNILYRGLDNPMSISVPGFSDMQTIVDFGDVPFTKHGPGRYVIHPTAETPRQCKVSVSVKMPSGDIKAMGYHLYRVRNIPSPVVFFGSKQGGPIAKGELIAIRNIVAGCGPDFAFEGLKYKVDSFTLKIVRETGQVFSEDVIGSQFTETINAQLKTVKYGDTILISNVAVRGPDGTKNLPGIILTVK
jgi:gliding motility-associated protein GldM